MDPLISPLLVAHDDLNCWCFLAVNITTGSSVDTIDRFGCPTAEPYHLCPSSPACGAMAFPPAGLGGWRPATPSVDTFS